MPIAVGSKAPDFTLKTKAADGLKDVTLSANFGQKQTVLLFFPAAFTGVCTDELCKVTGLLDEYNLYSSNGSVSNTTYSNCYAGTPPNSVWSLLSGIVYTKGCKYPNWYRSSSWWPA